jgi:hypothetical protein
MKAADVETQPLRYTHYLSAAFGGFMVGFAELIRAGDETTNVTVLRIAAVLRKQFTPLLGEGWSGLLVLTLFAIILCSIYRPITRKESFSLGFSVFAMLAALTPQEKQGFSNTDKGPLANLFFLSNAYAETLKSGNVGNYYFEFSNLQRKYEDKSGLLSVFDSKERNLLQKITFDTREIIKLQLPKGEYVVRFECNGCVRIRVNLTVEKDEDAAKIKLSNSNLPLSFQRLYNSDLVEINDVYGDELNKVIKRYVAQQIH